MAATIKDVARAAQVSVATVSRFVNGSGAVRPETAQRIEDAIAALSFRPNALGRSLKTATTRSLGILIPSLSNPVFADAVAGINEVARDAGYTLMFTAAEYDPEVERTAVSALLDYRIDAAILTVADADDSDALDQLEAAGVPYILIYNQPGALGRPTVTVDNVGAGRAAAEHLVSLGHTRLAMVSGRFSASDRARARSEGFIAGAQAAGLSAPSVREMDFVDSDTEAALRALFPTGRPDETTPSALFCSNDLLAISVIGALGRMGLSVPADVSVIGFDGIAIGRQLHPTLATVVQPSREMGRVAARRLLDRLSGGGDPVTTTLPYSLCHGESAGKAAKHIPADSPGLHRPS